MVMVKGNRLVCAVEVLQEQPDFVGVRTKWLWIYGHTPGLKNSFRFPEGKWAPSVLQHFRLRKNNI